MHANDLLRQEGGHGCAQEKGQAENGGRSPTSELHTRVRQLEDQVAILMAAVPPSVSIPAAQRIASTRRGSSVDGSKSRSGTNSRSRSLDSASQGPASSRNSSARSKRSQGSAYPHVFTTLQCSFCPHIMHVSGKSSTPIRAVCEGCVRMYAQNDRINTHAAPFVAATPQGFPVVMTVGALPTANPYVA